MAIKMKSEQRWTKKRLEITLSKLKTFEHVDVKLEQYETPSDIAAEWIWNAALKRDVFGKVSVDAACGPGILGCAALLLGAKKVCFVDKSEEAIKLAKANVNKLEAEFEMGKSEFFCQDIVEFDQIADVIIQNPPFGTKVKHSDKKFLETAFKVSPVVYSMHKITTIEFVEAIARDHHFSITDVWRYEFPIKQSLPWHRKKVVKVSVGLWRMMKQT